jgi:hypothetical protein
MIRLDEKEEQVPHNFIRINAVAPNPGRWTRDKVEPICTLHNGKFEHLWFDDDRQPNFAYVLVQDGDVDGMLHDLHGHSCQRLFDEHEVKWQDD